MQQLEILAYQIPRVLKRKQMVYQVGDLESLSATALYYGDGSSSGSSSGSGGGFGSFGIVETAYEKGTKKKGPSSGGPKPSITNIDIPKIGMELAGGLKIKKVGENTMSLQEDWGGVGNLYTLHPDGHGAIRFYGLGEGKAKEKKTGSW